MKKITLILFTFLVAVTFKSFGQKLEINKIDNVTNSSVKNTSWETLFTSFTANAYFRISLMGDDETFDIKYQEGKVLSILKGQELVLKLDNGGPITLTNNQYAVSCTGCGAKGFIGSESEGIQASYALTKDQIEKLKTSKIVDVKISTTTKEIENDVKDKNAIKVQKSLNLL